jgi:hypothetical protein
MTSGPNGHTCEGKVRAASTCPACSARRPLEAPPPERWPMMPSGSLKPPYGDAPACDRNGLKPE